MPGSSVPTIAHINTNARWGGGERQILALLDGARRHGFAPALIGRPGSELLQRASRIPGCTAIPFGFRSRYSPLAHWRMTRLLRRLQPALLHVHDSGGTYLGVTAARLLGGLPVVLHRRISSAIRRNPMSRCVYRARCIDTYVAVSRSAERGLLDAGVGPERIVIVPSGVDVELGRKAGPRGDLRRKLGLGSGVWLGVVSSLEKKKDVETFVRAAALLLARRADVRFLVVGGGVEERALRQLAHDLGLGDRVRFTGPVRDAYRYTAALDVFAFPSLREGSPGVVKEAMALGVPVVAARAPGTTDVVCGETARLVGPGDVQGFAVALLELLADEPARVALAGRARARVVEAFPIEGMVDRVADCYRRILNPVAATVVPPGRAAASRSA